MKIEVLPDEGNMHGGIMSISDDKPGLIGFEHSVERVGFITTPHHTANCFVIDGGPDAIAGRQYIAMEEIVEACETIEHLQAVARLAMFIFQQSVLQFIPRGQFEEVSRLAAFMTALRRFSECRLTVIEGGVAGC